MTRNHSEQTTDNVLHFENISLNRSTFVLEGEGESIRLAGKEYQMLEMLMMHPGQVISADQFMEKIWGFESDAEQSVVWVNLSNLRKKLTSIHAHVQIKAVRGLGYALEVANDKEA